MALRLELRVIDTETGTPTEIFTHMDLEGKELGFVNMLVDTLQFGGEIIKLDLD